MPGLCCGNYGSYRLPAVQDASIMPGNGDEPLTSFAENPTKSVERDALVEAQFTRPEEVKVTRVENRWLPCKPKQCSKMPVRILLALCFSVILAIFIVGLFVIFSRTSTASPAKEVLVYTLPTDNTDETSTAHAKMIMPAGVIKKPNVMSMHKFVDNGRNDFGHLDSTVKTTAAFEAVSDSITEKSGQYSSSEEDYTETSIDTTEFVTEPTSTSTTTSTAAPTTSTLPDNLQFFQTMGGEKSETCMERFAMGSPSGIYPITAEKTFEVYCDMDVTTGGWTVIQRRSDREGSFHKRTMKEYVSGFGDLRGNHWLGLDKISQLAPPMYAPATLRIEIEGETCDSTCSRRYADKWVGEWNIHIGSAKDGYKLTAQESIVGNLTFNGVDPFMNSNGARFSTSDQDQDDADFINCAQFRMLGPWWHGAKCSDVALNGYYQTISEKYDTTDKNQNAKRYFVWAFEKQIFNQMPYIIHIHKSTMLLKPSF